MDFRNRNEQPVSTGRVAPASPMQTMGSATMLPKEQKGQNDRPASPGWLRWVYVALLFSVTVLCVGVAYFLSTYNPNESRYILTDKYQAVFLSNGQVYFGKIASLNSRYIDLHNIFYLNSQSQTNGQSNSDNSKNDNQFTLVKLGCELHGPYDQMLINHSNVTFWENLQDSSQVVKSIQQWQKQNPNGQTCTSATSGTGQSSTTNTSSNSSSNSTSNTSSSKQ